MSYIVEMRGGSRGDKGRGRSKGGNAGGMDCDGLSILLRGVRIVTTTGFWQFLIFCQAVVSNTRL
jgi:hypothetical protein